MFNQYLNGSSFFEFPSFSVAVLTMLLALLLSTVIALTYKLVFQEENFSSKFFQAIVLISTSAAIVMMVVGDNLAVGFGVLAIVSMMSFRKLIRNYHNIIFIFAAISIGIATGEYSYVIAISGTTLFCYLAVLLYYPSFEDDQN